MKQRFNILDILASIKDIKEKCVGLRVTNIYDIDNKNFLIRLGSAENRQTIFIEYGKKVYLTNYTWTKNMFPSSFSMKCRKTIGNRKLSDVKLLGVDRVMILQFGFPPSVFSIIIEMYDKGNMVLVDNEFTILLSCRVRKVNDEMAMRPSQKYDLSNIRQQTEILDEKILEILKSAPPKSNIKKYLTSQFLYYGSNLIEHSLFVHKFNKNEIFDENMTEKQYELLIEAIKLSDTIFKDFYNNRIKGGFIILKTTNDSKKIHDEYHPIIYEYLRDKEFLKFETFCEAVDEYYSKIELTKMDTQMATVEKNALAKVENVKKDHMQRLNVLAQEKDKNFDAAELIIQNNEIVDDAIYLVNSALADQVAWKQIDEYISKAKPNHPIASVIEYTKFETNEIALKLNNEDGESHVVLVDLSKGAFANSKSYYQNRKFLIDKIERTQGSQQKALSSAQSKMKTVLKENEVKVKIKKNRKIYWFEKFRWFISSDNYLVLAGRDAAENEYLVKKQTTKYDIFVHAELHGSAAVIIKVNKEQINENSKTPVPIRTLCEAGSFAICFSSAWDSHVTVPAYWVHMDQVSKTAPTGEYLSVGGFSIRGTKNFLPLPTLILGIGVMFKIDQNSNTNHLNDRLPKWGDETKEPEVETEVLETDAKNEIEIISENEENSTSDLDSEPQIFDTKLLSEAINVENSKSKTQIEKSSIQNLNKQKVKTEKEPTKKQTARNEPAKLENTEKETTSNPGTQSQFKRGQKSKYKLKQQKYKDQDESDRQLADTLLHVSLKPQTSKKKIKLLKEKEKSAKINETVRKEPKKEQIIKQTEIELDSEDSDTEKISEQQFLSSFISEPIADEDLLFSMLVIAPYSCLLPYKYKVKLTPGTTKRGKAVKTALTMFLSSKDGCEKERILISALKDQDNTRNLPPSVKVSAPNMTFIKKKMK